MQTSSLDGGDGWRVFGGWQDGKGETLTERNSVFSGGGIKVAKQKQASEWCRSARLSGDRNINMTCICQSVDHIHRGKN